MKRILKDPHRFFEIINRINSYSIESEDIKFKKTIDKLDFDKVYDQVLEFVENSMSHIDILEECIDFEQKEETDISYRIKTEQSLKLKWDKNLEAKRPLKKVCNDVIGIRIITSLKSGDLRNITLDGLEEYNIQMVNFYDKPKSNDDGYRGIHLYIKNNPKGFPLEVQIWTQEDAILNFYTHEVIYKRMDLENGSKYAYELRKWIDSVPVIPDEVGVSLVKYLYQFLYLHLGGE